MKDTVSIMIVGVGGQGTLLASKLLGNVLLKNDFDVKISEVHGMSQRGGSVVTYVRYGEKVYSPIIDRGDADFIIAFEQLEAFRWASHLKKSGILITNTQKITPMPVITGAAYYPENIGSKLSALPIKYIEVDAITIADGLGNAKAVNVVMLGVLTKYIGIDKQLFLSAIIDNVPQKFLELNVKAFEIGYNFNS